MVEVTQNQRIVLEWGAAPEPEDPAGAYDTRVTMTFAALEDGRTLVTIVEEGWKQTEAGLQSCISNTEGWTGMLCALKVWIEHGINLREGFYK